jgi:hypothetical protein
MSSPISPTHISIASFQSVPPKQSFLWHPIILGVRGIDTTIPVHLNMFPGKDAANYYALRLVYDNSLEERGHCAGSTEVDTAIMSEVMDWWQLQQSDAFWAPRNKQEQKVSYLSLTH